MRFVAEGAPCLYPKTDVSKNSNYIPMNTPMAQLHNDVIFRNTIVILTILGRGTHVI